jgi:sensor histidine kinase regulating citrate/malate metabolism
MRVTDNGPVARAHQDKIRAFLHHQADRFGHRAWPLCLHTMAGKLGGSLEYADAAEGGAVFTLRLPDGGEGVS